MADLAEALEPLLDALADKIVARLTAGALPGMVDQVGSPLGRRRHIAAVRERVARGDPGAAVVGRRHFLTRDAMAEELARLGGKAKRVPRDAPDGLEELRERYGVEKVRR